MQRLLIILALVWLTIPRLAAEPVAGAPPEPRPADVDITKWVATILEHYHYANHPIDDNVSNELFEQIFSSLDPNRYYFTAEDLAEFEPYREVLDDMVRRGHVDFAFRIHQRFVERLRDRLEYVRRRVHEPFDFTIDESIAVKRDKAPWPHAGAEQDELWRKVVKNQLLVAQLVDQFREEAAKKAAAKEEDAPAATVDPYGGDKPATDKPAARQERPPAERVVHFYEEYLRNVLEDDGDDVLEQYLTALSELYDPHSSYMNWRSFENFNIAMRLSLPGIGALLVGEDGYTKVVSVLPNGPAEKDGRLRAGDLIVGVAQGDAESEDVVNMPLEKVVRKIRGEVGTKVRLTVTHGPHGVPSEIVLTREEVKLTEQEARASVFDLDRDPGKLRLGVVDLDSFYADFDALNAGDPNAKRASRDVRGLIQRMLDHHHVAGLVIDLRGDGGGSLEEAIDMAGLFIPTGPVVQVKSGRGTEVREDDDGGFAYDLPLVVMTDHGTASASEIFAGAMQDYGRGVIVGDSGTHGKGTVQTVKDLAEIPPLMESRPGALKFTMAKFYRVTGRSTQLRGVQPDIVLPSIYDYLELGERYQQHALAWDEIDAQPVHVNRAVVDALPLLRQRSADRLAANERYQRYIADVDHYGKRRQDPTISLVRDARVARYREDEYWTERSREIYNTDSLQETDDTGAAEDEKNDAEAAGRASATGPLPERAAAAVKDVYLAEALNILADLVEVTSHTQLAAKTDDPAKTPVPAE